MGNEPKPIHEWTDEDLLERLDHFDKSIKADHYTRCPDHHFIGPSLAELAVKRIKELKAELVGKATIECNFRMLQAQSESDIRHFSSMKSRYSQLMEDAEMLWKNMETLNKLWEMSGALRGQENSET